MDQWQPELLRRLVQKRKKNHGYCFEKRAQSIHALQKKHNKSSGSQHINCQSGQSVAVPGHTSNNSPSLERAQKKTQQHHPQTHSRKTSRLKPPRMSKSETNKWAMAPDILTVSARPEWRLKAVIQANALVDALIAAACMVARVKIAELLNLPSATFSVALGFAFAFGSAFMFRITVKDPVPRNFALVGASGNVFLTLFLSAFVIFDFLKFTPTGARIVAVVAAVHACFGLIQFALIHRSTYGYGQTEAVAV